MLVSVGSKASSMVDEGGRGLVFMFIFVFIA